MQASTHVHMWNMFSSWNPDPMTGTVRMCVDETIERRYPISVATVKSLGNIGVTTLRRRIKRRGVHHGKTHWCWRPYLRSDIVYSKESCWDKEWCSRLWIRSWFSLRTSVLSLSTKPWWIASHPLALTCTHHFSWHSVIYFRFLDTISTELACGHLFVKSSLPTSKSLRQISAR